MAKTTAMDVSLHIQDPVIQDNIQDLKDQQDQCIEELMQMTQGIAPYTKKDEPILPRTGESWADMIQVTRKSWADMAEDDDGLDPDPPMQRMMSAALQPPAYYVPKKHRMVKQLLMGQITEKPQDEWIHVKMAELKPTVTKKRDLHRVLNSFQFKDWQANSLHISDDFKDPRFFKLTQYIDSIPNDVVSLKQLRATIEDVNSPISPECKASFERLQRILNSIADRIARTLAD